jgi:uncharacterized protein YcbX
LAGLARIHAARPDALDWRGAAEGSQHITRCAAVNVDPDTAARDLDIPAAIMRRLGHNECGIYAEVTEAGTVSVGDAIAIAIAIAIEAQQL